MVLEIINILVEMVNLIHVDLIDRKTVEREREREMERERQREREREEKQKNVCEREIG